MHTPSSKALPIIQISYYFPQTRQAQGGLLFPHQAQRGLQSPNPAQRGLLPPRQAQGGLLFPRLARRGLQLLSLAQIGLLPPRQAQGGLLFSRLAQRVKSSHLYLYSAFNNTNCDKATAQYQNGKIVSM